MKSLGNYLWTQSKFVKIAKLRKISEINLSFFGIILMKTIQGYWSVKTETEAEIDIHRSARAQAHATVASILFNKASKFIGGA